MDTTPISPDDPAAPLPSAPARPSPHPRLPAWARTLLTTVLFLPTATAGLIVAVVPPVRAALEGSDDAVAVPAFALMCAVTLAAYLLVSAALTRFVDRRPLRVLGLGGVRRALIGLAVGTGAAVALGVAVGGLLRLTGWGGQFTLPDDVAEGEMTVGAVALLVAWVLLRAYVLQGIGEEVLFRGYLLQSLSARPRVAILVSTVAFTVPHLGSQGGQESVLERFLYLILPLGFSLSAAVLGILTRSVWAAAGIHGGMHVGLAVMAGLDLPVEGPAVWVSVGVAHALLALVAARWITPARWAQVAAHGPYTPAPTR